LFGVIVLKVCNDHVDVETDDFVILNSTSKVIDVDASGGSMVRMRIRTNLHPRMFDELVQCSRNLDSLRRKGGLAGTRFRVGWEIVGS
jgi:hypothetical protein